MHGASAARSAHCPAAVVEYPGGKLRVHKATYAANAPSEDRATVVVGADFVFGGVWDGHGGIECSQYVERHAFEQFVRSISTGQGEDAVWTDFYRRLDAEYKEEAGKVARKGKDMEKGGETERKGRDTEQREGAPKAKRQT